MAVEAANEVMDKLVELDARPSDALMIAAQFGTGIKIVPAVWESMENILPQLEQLDADSRTAARRCMWESRRAAFRASAPCHFLPGGMIAA